jgi:sugar phosphate isomerase/epimerase
MEINYICTYWGSEQLSAKAFLAKVIANGYDGVEINLPDDVHFITEFMDELEHIRTTQKSDFIFIAQQVLPSKNETVNEYIERLSERLNFLTALQPNYINSHTGKDYYDFEDNCRILELTAEISQKSGIPIWHEIHRGRFSFHLKTLLTYLDKYPELNLIADFSHFCVVSESCLEDQQDLLVKLYPTIKHIHARVGFEQSPQVNNPFAPEWKNHLDLFTSWWKKIVENHRSNNHPYLTITPEFGPFPYMPETPFTKEPLSNQWEINCAMKNYLQQTL